MINMAIANTDNLSNEAILLLKYLLKADVKESTVTIKKNEYKDIFGEHDNLTEVMKKTCEEIMDFQFIINDGKVRRCKKLIQSFSIDKQTDIVLNLDTNDYQGVLKSVDIKKMSDFKITIDGKEKKLFENLDISDGKVKISFNPELDPRKFLEK